MQQKNRPTIGIALSGGSTKAIAQVGALEEFRENGIPIDYLVGCSSGAIAASSFAAGTIEDLKQMYFNLTKREILGYLSLSQLGEDGSLFDEKKVEKLLRKFTKDKNFEDVYPRLGLIACDLETKEVVNLQSGDIARACLVSCSMPFVLPPRRWGNRILVDGGMAVRAPATDEVRKMGADIVIGIDVAKTLHMFTKQVLTVRDGYNKFKQSLVQDEAPRARVPREAEPLSWFDIIGKAMDVEIELKINQLEMASCDVLISPRVKHYGKIETDSGRLMYEEGRRAAKQAVPRIRELMNKFELAYDRNT